MKTISWNYGGKKLRIVSLHYRIRGGNVKIVSFYQGILCVWGVGVGGVSECEFKSQILGGKFRIVSLYHRIQGKSQNFELLLWNSRANDRVVSFLFGILGEKVRIVRFL